MDAEKIIEEQEKIIQQQQRFIDTLLAPTAVSMPPTGSKKEFFAYLRSQVVDISERKERKWLRRGRNTVPLLRPVPQRPRRV